MESKGLRIGQSLEDGRSTRFAIAHRSLSARRKQAVLNKPVSDLNLSVRAPEVHDPAGHSDAWGS